VDELPPLSSVPLYVLGNVSPTNSMSLKKAIFASSALLLVLVVSPSSAQDVRIVHSVEQQRDGLYTAHVMITNMTSTTIPNWVMSFRLDSHVETIQNASWSEFQNAFTVNGQGWTKKILPGDVIWFTIFVAA